MTNLEIRKHIEATHEKKRDFACNVCEDTKFYSKRQLSLHVRGKYQKEFIVDFNWKMFLGKITSYNFYSRLIKNGYFSLFQIYILPNFQGSHHKWQIFHFSVTFLGRKSAESYCKLFIYV